MSKGSLIAAVAAIATFFLVAQVANAQYPPPKTSLVCAVSQIEVKISGSSVVAATLRDSSGSALSGRTVHFWIESGDASLSSDSAVTDSSGTAVVTIFFGDTSGTVVVGANSDSAECRTSTDVNGIVPPSTGSAGLMDGGSDTASYIGLGLVAALTAFGLIALRKPRTA